MTKKRTNDAEASQGKNAQLVLRLNKSERDAFVALCKKKDTTAAREIRKFIRKFVAKNEKTS